MIVNLINEVRDQSNLRIQQQQKLGEQEEKLRNLQSKIENLDTENSNLKDQIKRYKDELVSKSKKNETIMRKLFFRKIKKGPILHQTGFLTNPPNPPQMIRATKAKTCGNPIGHLPMPLATEVAGRAT